MGHKPSQKVSLSCFGPLYRNINKGYNLVFFMFGVSLGIAAVLCLNLSFSLQAFLYPVITPITTILPSPLSSSRLLSVTAPPPLESFLSSQNTMFNSPSTELKTSLMHNMTDQELFLKASSMISGTQDFTEQTVPKVAFMFLARGPLPLAPLWEKFFKGHDGFYSIYLHQHPCFSETMPEDSVFYGRNIPSELVVWGAPSLMDAGKRLLANALMDISNQRFVLLSESCIPLFGFRTIYDYLMNSTMSFLDSNDDPGYNARGRYCPKMWPIIDITDWRKGSQWFEVHRELAIHIVSDTKYYPIVQHYCTSPCFAEEHFMPTFVHMMYPQLSSNSSVTWVDWSWSGPHPRTFVSNDITEAFLNQMRFGSTCVYEGNITNMCFLFARKFHPSALKPLLLLLSPLLLGIDT